MNAITIIFMIIILLLVCYLAYLQTQLHNINKQLTRRLEKRFHQPVSVQFINKELNKLVNNINKCLKAEESLRLDGIREEKRFKELIANISHDLRTPLTAIKGYLQLMEKSELSDSQRSKLNVSIKHAIELEQLIEQFFEYSYLLNAEPSLKLEKINLTNLLTECLADSVAVFEENHLSIKLDEEIPSIYVLGDREVVIRILRNLIRNGVQHSAGEIKVELIQQDHHAIIVFKNQVKPGMDVNAEKLFDRFYSGDRARHHSTGLGLSIVKLLTEQMGGNVSATILENMLNIQIQLPLYLNK